MTVTKKKHTPKKHAPQTARPNPPSANPTNGLESLFLVGRKLNQSEIGAVLSADVSLSMSQISQIQFKFYDPHFALLENGLLLPNARVDLGKDLIMRVSSTNTVDMGNGDTGLDIACRPDAVRKLKAAQGSLVLKNVSPSQFVVHECNRLGIKHKVQPSQKRDVVHRDQKVPGTHYGPTSGNALPSSWSTFQRLAQELGFVCFESFGYVYFGKPTWFVAQFENDAMEVYWDTGPVANRNPYVPECHRTLDGELKTVNVVVPYERWKECRPGRTFKLHGVPYFDRDNYIISEVSYDLTGRSRQINVTATIPVNPKKDAALFATSPDGLAAYTQGNSLRALCQWAGWRGQDLNIAVAVATAESKGNARALGDTTITTPKWGPSVGLFQIRTLKHPGDYSGVDAKRVYSKLFDAEYNAQLAHSIWKKDGWRPWSTYTSGAYKQYLGKDREITGWTNTHTAPKIPGTDAANASGPGRIGDKTSDTFVRVALQQAGDQYIFGTEVSLSDSNPDAFDCCLTGDSMVSTTTGPVRIDEVQPGMEVFTWDDGKMLTNRVVAQKKQKKQTVYRVRTRNRSIRASANHPFMVLRKQPRKRSPQGSWLPVEWVPEWTRVDALQRGDVMVTAKSIPMPVFECVLSDGTPVDEDVAWLLGLFIGDGHIPPRNPRVCVYGETRKRAAQIVRDKWGANSTEHEVHGLIIHSAHLARVLIGALGSEKARTKRVPASTSLLGPELIRAFCAGYADADGHLDKRGYQSYASASRDLVAGVRSLHVMLGDSVSNISTNFRKKPIVINGKLVKDAAPLHTFQVYPDSNRQGQKLLDVYGARRALPDENFSVETLLSVEEDGYEDTYDLQIEGTENFIADGYLVHNSELVQWAAARAGVKVPDGSSAQRSFCKKVTVEKAINTRGALLFHPGHVAISLGNGRTIEAANSRVGVVSYSARGRFEAGGLIPGMHYGRTIISNTAHGSKFHNPGV